MDDVIMKIYKYGFLFVLVYFIIAMLYPASAVKDLLIVDLLIIASLVLIKEV